MMIYTYVIYLLLIFALGKNACALDTNQVGSDTNNLAFDHLSIGSNTLTNLPSGPLGGIVGTGISSYRFLNVAFKGKLYAFQRASSLDDGARSIFVWTSSNKGAHWSHKTKIPCNLDRVNGACDIMSSMIIDNKLVVIYGNSTQYAISKSTDGLKWKASSAMYRSFMSEKNIIYYSGTPFDPSDSDTEKTRYITCFDTTDRYSHRGRDINKTVAACSISHDEGKTWEISFYLRIKQSSDYGVQIYQIFYLKGTVHFIATVNKEKHKHYICSLDNGNAKLFNCENQKMENQDTIMSVFDMNTSGNTAVFISKRSDVYTKLIYMNETNKFEETLLTTENSMKRAIARDDLVETSSEGIIPYAHKIKEFGHEESIHSMRTVQRMSSEEETNDNQPEIMFHVMFVNETSLSILYEQDHEIYNIRAELKKQKTGCQFLPCTKRNKYLCTGYKGDYTKTIYYQFLNDTWGNHCHMSGFEPTNDDKYVHFFVKVPADVYFETSDDCFKHSHSTNEKDSSPKFKYTVIHIKNVVHFEDDNGKKMKEIEFFYPTALHSILKNNYSLSCTATNSSFNISYYFPWDKKGITAVLFPVNTADLSVDENRLALNDYDWNTANRDIPKGSYVIYPMLYVRRFFLYTNIMNNLPNAQEQLNDFQESYTTGLNQDISVPQDEISEDYEGIDFTDSSPHYKLIQTDIQEDKTFTINVVVSKEGTTVGLVCPLQRETSPGDSHCFSYVIDSHNNLVPFNSVFQKIPFFIAPSTILYNKKLLAVESLLYLYEHSYDELDKLDTGIEFQCVCKVNKHTVNVKFNIKTKSHPRKSVQIPPKTETKEEKKTETKDEKKTETKTETKTEQQPQTQPQTEAEMIVELQNKTGTSTHNMYSSFLGLLILLNIFFVH